MKLKNPINSTKAAEILAEITGKKWDRKKVHLYWKRGTKGFPYPDEMPEYSGPLWERETIIKHGNKLKSDAE